MTLPSDKPLKLDKQYRFQWEPAQDCFVILYPEGVVKLDASAGQIMRRVDGKTSAQEIVAQLVQAFPGVDLRQDVIVFLEHAHDKGWIKVCE